MLLHDICNCTFDGAYSGYIACGFEQLLCITLGNDLLLLCSRVGKQLVQCSVACKRWFQLYVTFHEETKHNVLGINLRYRPN